MPRARLRAVAIARSARRSGRYDAAAAPGAAVGLACAETHARRFHVFRRLAALAQPRVVGAQRPAAARRDQPRIWTPCCGGAVAAQVSRHADADQPRPRVPRRGRQPHPAPPRRPCEALRRRLHRLRAPARRAIAPAADRARQGAGRARPPAGLRRPLPRQGDQGQAGPVAHEAAGKARRHRSGARRARPAHRLRRAGKAADLAGAAGGAGCGYGPAAGIQDLGFGIDAAELPALANPQSQSNPGHISAPWRGLRPRIGDRASACSGRTGRASRRKRSPPVGELPLLAGERSAPGSSHRLLRPAHGGIAARRPQPDGTPAPAGSRRRAAGVRDFLGRWNFAGDRAEPVDGFSGGERAHWRWR